MSRKSALHDAPPCLFVLALLFGAIASLADCNPKGREQATQPVFSEEYKRPVKTFRKGRRR